MGVFLSNRNYVKGANFERARVNLHKARGAIWAARIAGSHSPFDVVALYGDGRLYLEQCKTGKVTSHIIREAVEKAPTVPEVCDIFVSIETPKNSHPI